MILFFCVCLLFDNTFAQADGKCVVHSVVDESKIFGSVKVNSDLPVVVYRQPFSGAKKSVRYAVKTTCSKDSATYNAIAARALCIKRGETDYEGVLTFRTTSSSALTQVVGVDGSYAVAPSCDITGQSLSPPFERVPNCPLPFDYSSSKTMTTAAATADPSASTTTSETTTTSTTIATTSAATTTAAPKANLCSVTGTDLDTTTSTASGGSVSTNMTRPSNAIDPFSSASNVDRKAIPIVAAIFALVAGGVVPLLAGVRMPILFLVVCVMIATSTAQSSTHESSKRQSCYSFIEVSVYVPYGIV